MNVSSVEFFIRTFYLNYYKVEKSPGHSQCAVVYSCLYHLPTGFPGLLLGSMNLCYREEKNYDIKAERVVFY